MLLAVSPDKCITHKTDEAKVSRFVMLLLEIDLPPIRAIHHNGLYYVTDGAHRVAAYAYYGLDVYAYVVESEDASDEEIALLGSRGHVLHGVG